MWNIYVESLSCHLYNMHHVINYHTNDKIKVTVNYSLKHYYYCYRYCYYYYYYYYNHFTAPGLCPGLPG